MEIETRASALEVKTISESGEFEGYGSVFGVVDTYQDVVMPGAFKESLAEWQKRGSLPKMLWQHDGVKPIGVWQDMKEDGRGLYVKGRLLTTVRAGAEALALLKEKAIEGLSIGFQTTGQEYDGDVRKLTGIKLWEVSLVTFPANVEATITNAKASIKTLRDFERFLRDAGFSRSEAKTIASHGFAGNDQAGTADLLDSCKSLLNTIKGL